MLLYAFLLKENLEWEEARIRILRIVDNETAHLQAKEHLEELCLSARVPADVEVIVSQASFEEVIATESAHADMVFLGMDTPVHGCEIEFANQLREQVKTFPHAVFVKSSTKMDITT